MRIAKRWANSKFFSDTIIPQLISNMVRNAILSLSDFGQTTSYSLEELEHLKKAISDICDFKKYTLLFNVCIAFKMSKEMRFTKEECSFFIELSSDFLCVLFFVLCIWTP